MNIILMIIPIHMIMTILMTMNILTHMIKIMIIPEGDQLMWEWMCFQRIICLPNETADFLKPKGFTRIRQNDPTRENNYRSER